MHTAVGVEGAEPSADREVAHAVPDNHRNLPRGNLQPLHSRFNGGGVVVDRAKQRFEIDRNKGYMPGPQLPRPRGPEATIAEEAMDQNDHALLARLCRHVIPFDIGAKWLTPERYAGRSRDFTSPGASHQARTRTMRRVSALN